MGTLGKVLAGSVPVIAVLVGAAFFIPPDFPHLARQLLLCAWGVGGILVAERLLFGSGWLEGLKATGFVPANGRTVAVALICSLPMWLFLPVYGWVTGAPVGIRADWLPILLGVILVNGIAEEVIHRGFVFGHLRKERSFAAAATISAAVFAGQHVYLCLTIGLVPGLASVVLAALLAFPLAFIFEKGGNSAVGPAILHTSSNAPIMIFALPPAMGSVLLPHMAIVLVSIYLCFVFGRWLTPRPLPAPGGGV